MFFHFHFPFLMHLIYHIEEVGERKLTYAILGEIFFSSPLFYLTEQFAACPCNEEKW